MTRVLNLFAAAIAIEGGIALVDHFAPSADQVPLVPGVLMTCASIVFQIVAHAVPATLVAIAAAQVASAPWFLVPRERRALKAASLLILTFPAYWLGIRTLALTAPGIGGELAQWIYPFVALTSLTGIVLLFRGLGLCCDRDRGGAERTFMRYLWIGAAIPAGGTVLISFSTLFVLWQVSQGIPIPARPLEATGNNLGRSFLILLIVATPALWFWRKALAEAQAEASSATR